MRLLGVELSRFRSRRGIAFILLAAAILTAVLAVTTIWDTRPVSASDTAAAQAQVDAETQSPRFQRQLARCQEKPRRFTGGDDPEVCAESMTPQLDWYLDRRILSLEELKGDTGTAVIMIVAGLMIIVGATFAGADWSSGSISNQVMFQPRRMKVWLAKAAAVLLATMTVAALVIAGFWFSVYLVAESRGIHTGTQVMEDIAWMSARGVLMTGAGAVGGFALTMLVRHTVGTLAVLFAYTVGGEALTSALPVEGVGRWALSNNVFAWLNHGFSYYDSSLPCRNSEFGCEQMARLSIESGAWYLGVLLAVVLVLSMVSFVRRDID